MFNPEFRNSGLKMHIRASLSLYRCRRPKETWAASIAFVEIYIVKEEGNWEADVHFNGFDPSAENPIWRSEKNGNDRKNAHMWNSFLRTPDIDILYAQCTYIHTYIMSQTIFFSPHFFPAAEEGKSRVSHFKGHWNQIWGYRGLGTQETEMSARMYEVELVMSLYKSGLSFFSPLALVIIKILAHGEKSIEEEKSFFAGGRPSRIKKWDESFCHSHPGQGSSCM